MKYLLNYLRLVFGLGAGLGYSFLATAQPTLVAEQRQPARYITNHNIIAHQGELFSFALPGRRYAHCGTSYVSGSTRLIFSVTKANGDTVRFVKVGGIPSYEGDDALGAVLNPDYTLTYLRILQTNGPSATRRDSIGLLTLDTLGRVVWRKAHLLPSGFFRHLVRVGDGYLITRSPPAFPGSGSFFLRPGLWKFDLQGNSVWMRDFYTRGYAGVGGLLDLALHPDGSYMAIGYADNGAPYTPGQSAAGRTDYLLVKLRPNGDTLWTRCLALPGQDEYGTRLRLCPDGGFALLGYRYRTTGPGIGPGVRAIQEGQVVRTDSTGQLRWSQNEAPLPFEHPYKLLQPLTNDDVLFGGVYTEFLPVFISDGLIRRYSANGQPVWEYRRAVPNHGISFESMVNHADGSAYLVSSRGTIINGAQRSFSGFTHLANVGRPYEPELCATPPQASLATALDPARPSALIALEFSTPGPRYAELVAWRWDYGDGTTYDGQHPPPHVYALPLPAPGTPVTLTVTNNLGCTSTATDYPFGRPTASQAARALSAGLRLWPNPATSTLSLARPAALPGPATVQVLDALGRLVLAPVALPAGPQPLTLDVAALPAGVYVLRLLTQQGPLNRRFVKE